MSENFLPRQDVALTDSAGRASNPFYVWFLSLERALQSGVLSVEGLQEQTTGIATALGSPDGTVENIPESAFLPVTASVTGFGSIRTFGTLAAGIVQITLENDNSNPGNTYYYGTGQDGIKGWFTVASALAVEARLDMVVGDDGVTTFDLAELPDSGIGVSPIKIHTRDAYGRIEGEQDADTGDLPEGSNLYFTIERAQDAAGSILADSPDIDFTYDDAAPSISAALTPAVHASLALADSAVQSVVAGANVTVDVTDPRNPIVSATGGGGSGGGAATFRDLTDTPASYAGAGGKAVAVNMGETGLTFVPLGGGGTVTSVDVSAGVGLDASGGPITGAGTITVGLDAASVASLALADSAVQPADSVSTLSMETNRILGRTTAGLGAVEEIAVGANLTLAGGVLSASAPGTGTVTSVAVAGTDGIEVDSGSPITTAGTIQLGLSPTVIGQLSAASTAVQPGDNISSLTNDAGYVNAAEAVAAAPVQSVNGTVGAVMLVAGDVGAEPSFVKGDLVAGANVAMVGSLAGRLVGPGDVTITATDSSTAWGGITGTLSDQTDLQEALNAKLDDSQASAFGLDLLSDTDAAAARTTLGLGTAATQPSTAFATAAQGMLAESSVQPGDVATTLSMATARLLGRSTAGFGAVEQITVGANLTLSAGVLSATAGGGGDANLPAVMARISLGY